MLLAYLSGGAAASQAAGTDVRLVWFGFDLAAGDK
jgi:hypothetical protein